MGCENKKPTWFEVAAGPGVFQVEADCPPCAEHDVDTYLFDNPGVIPGINAIADLSVPATVSELEPARREHLQEIVSPMLGRQTVLLVDFRSEM